MEPNRKTLFATIFAAVMVASMFAPTAGAAAAMGAPSGDAIDVGQADIETDVQLDKANESNEYAEAGSTTEVVSSDDRSTERVDPSLRDASGDTVLLLSVERDLDGPIAAADAESAVDELVRDSAATQGPVIDEINENFPSVSHRNDFWAGNVVVVEADLDAIDPADVAAIDGVKRVSPNVEFERPAPQPETDGAEPDLDSEFTFGLEQINVPEFEDEFGVQGEGATVMIGDDGISDPDEGHPDLEFAQEVNVADGEINDGLGSPGAHGEHVAGTATAAADPAGDVPRYGVAPNADLLKANVFEGGASTEDIIASMEWAAEEDADVASFSLGFPPNVGLSTFAPVYVDVVDDVNAAGTAAVVSAGNSGSGDAGGPVTSPATNFDTVAIGASAEGGDIAAFSSGAVIDEQSIEVIGEGEYPDTFPDEYAQPDVSAPGADVLSSGPLGLDQIDDPNATYSFASGTSMAAPHYAGAVALLQSATEEDLDNAVIEAALAETAEKPENDFAELNSRDIRFGTGIIDVHAAAQALDERQTVEGTVTNTAGEPLVGATVETDAGALTATDEDGEFVLQTTNDPAEVTADASGARAETVTVEDGESVDFVLEESLDVELLQGQPATLEAGDDFEIVVAVENLDQLTVELTDDSTTSADDLTLSIGGDEIGLSDPVETGGLSGEVTILVEVDEAAVDTEFSLEHTFERFGEDPGEAVFEVSGLDAPATAEPGEEIDVSATVTNTGDDAGTQTVEFVFDGDTVAEQEVSLDADESADVTFEGIPLPDAEGEFEHGVFTDDDSQTATIVIEEVDAEATVSFADEEVVFAPDTAKTVPVQTDAADVAGYQVTIEFDPSVLQVDTITTGDVGNGPTTDIDNENGTVSFVDSQANGLDQPDLANVTFEFVGEAGEETDLEITDDGTTVTTAGAEDLETVGQEVTWTGGQLGDVNADGDITPADAVLTQQFVAGQEPAGEFIEELADVNQNGEVTISDVLAIEALILGVDADADSATATDFDSANDDEEIVVVTGPTEVSDELEGPEFELSNLDQSDTLEIDEDIVSAVELTNVGDETGSTEIIHAVDIDDSFVFIPAEIENIELEPGESTTVEKNIGSFEDINDALGSGFEPGDDVLTGFQIGENLNPNAPPEPTVEQELAEEITIAGSDFQVSDLDAPGEADPGEMIDVNATVTNLGTEADTQSVEFVFDGDTVADEEIELEPNESTTVSFEDIQLPDEEGAFEHGVFTEDDSQTATITVGDVDVVAVVDDGTFGETTAEADERDGATPDRPATEVGNDLIDRLGAQTNAALVGVSSDEAVDGAETGAYDAYVINQMDPSLVESFDDAVADDTGVVWLDQWGSSSNGVADKSEALDNPTTTSQSFTAPNPELEIVDDHPLFDGVGDEGDTVPIHAAQFADTTWFDGYDGDVVGQVQAGGVTDGDGVAVDENKNTVLLSSFGSNTFVGPDDYTEEADTVLGNAVAFVLEDDGDDGAVGFEVTGVEPSGDFEVEPEAELDVNATVENTGNESDTQAVEFVFAGDTVASENLTLDAGASETVAFTVTAPEAEGEYDWFVATEDDESQTWTLTVSGEESPDPTSVAVVGDDLDTEEIDEYIEELRQSDLSDEEIESRLDGIESDDVNDLSDTIGEGLDDDAYDVVDVSADELLDNMDHDVYVISDFEDESDVVDFQDALDENDGVVYLDNWNSFVGANGVVSLVEETNDPEETDNAFLGGNVTLELTEDHPLFDEVGDAGDVVTHMSADDADRRWFEGYNGDVLAEVDAEGEDLGGPAVGVDDEENEVLLSSHARENGAPDDAFTEESNQILFNAIEHVAPEDGDSTDSDEDADSVTATPIAA